MRFVIACCATLSLALAGCSSLQPSSDTPPAAKLPLDVGDAIGSQLGNYAMLPGADAKGPDGQHCVVFNWDRPLNKSFAIRYSSLSCDQPDKPWKTTTPYTITVIPISQSNLSETKN